MTGIWAASAQTYLLVLATTTTLFFAIPIFVQPLRWARLMLWRVPAETDLAIYFGRCLGAFILVIPYWFNTAAYAAVTSIAVIGLYIAYVIPVFLRVRAGKNFQAGPWNLGKWGVLNGTIATIWTVFICVLLLLPQLNPITAMNFNYAPLAVLAVIGFATIYWLASARKWFTGPKVQGTPAELAAIERELKLEEAEAEEHLEELLHHPIETIEHDRHEHGEHDGHSHE